MDSRAASAKSGASSGKADASSAKPDASSKKADASSGKAEDKAADKTEAVASAATVWLEFFNISSKEHAVKLTSLPESFDLKAFSYLFFA